MKKNPTILLFISLFLLTTSVQAQLYFFGRNKIQYDEFDWKLLKTEHFNIYYYGEFEEMAEIGAYYAEEAYKELQIKFDHVVVSTIPLIFYNTHIHFQQTNITPGFIPEGVGGFFEFLKGRVVIPYLGNLEQFRHVIRHELVHVFMTSKVLNNLRDHRVRADHLPPLWFVEGLAEYWSYHWDTQAEMMLRDAVTNEYFFSLSDINRIYGSFLMYKEGQIFLQFISETYGEDKILQFMENFWRFRSFNDVVSFTLGESIETVDDKWIFYVKQKYYPLFAEKKPHHIDSKKLTNFGFNFSPRIHKTDSTTSIIFIGNRTGYTSIFNLPFQPNSKKYAEPKLILRGEKEEIFETFHALKNSIDLFDDQVVFVTKMGGSDVLHLYSLLEDELIKTYNWDELISIESPNFSTDGKRVVFSAIDQKGFSDLYVFEFSSQKLQRITNDYYSDITPIFNKENNKIIFSSDRTGGKFRQKYNLFEYDLEKGNLKYLTYIDANSNQPHYSEDYSKLYFSSDYDGAFNFWELEIKDDQPLGMRQHTRFVTSIFDFDFIDDSTIVTSAFEKSSFQFYSLNLNSIPDSQLASVKFDFHKPPEIWRAKNVKQIAEFDRLKYEKEYTLDYAFSQIIADPVYGARGGAIFSISDLLGNDRYIFFLYNTAEVQSEFLKSFNLSISKINFSKRTNYGFGIFNFYGRRYDIRESDDFFYERSFGGFFSLIYPVSTFQRLEANITFANSDKELSESIIPRQSVLVSNSLSWIFDNTLWGPTGPLDGTRFRFLLGYTSDVKYSNENYYSVIADYRQYFRLSLRSAIAARLSLYANHGKNARRYFGGGSWDIRGWPRWSIRGEKLWVSSLELRFPLIDQLVINFPFFGLGFSSIRGAAFFDAGSAWDDEYEKTLGSIGVGLRINFFNVVTFRYDIGKKIEDDFKRLQPRLFYQFFFGWDF
ncbi:MAG: hypothetical protein PHW27_03880 [Melioribacteraceae bacterium]|nr:hypothetical protein [Melioribacteraceae bacterium]